MLSEVALFSFSVALSKFSQSKLESFACSSKNDAPLYDFLHATFPNVSKYEKLIDLIPLLVGCLSLIIALTHPHSIDVGNLLRVLSYVFILRSITTAVTILPSPICESNKKAEAIGGCHDCIFSGHTSATLIFCYFLYLHDKRFKWPLLAYSMFGSLMIIITRSHYTIDVIIAWIVVYAMLKYTDIDKDY